MLPGSTHYGDIHLELPLKDSSPIPNIDNRIESKIEFISKMGLEIGYFKQNLYKIVAGNTIKNGLEKTNKNDLYFRALTLQGINKGNDMTQTVCIDHIFYQDIMRKKEKSVKALIDGLKIPCLVPSPQEKSN